MYMMYMCLLNKERRRKTLLLPHPTHPGLVLISSREEVRLEDGGVAFRANLGTLGHREHCPGARGSRAEERPLSPLLVEPGAAPPED